MDINGFIAVDKPLNLTSYDVIRRFKKLSNITRIGHTGTLDPFATGLLLICFGKATRFAGNFLTLDKRYDVEILLGISHDTGDCTGNVIEQRDIVPIEESFITTALQNLTNITKLAPHRFSAVKIDGKRAYTLARNNQEVELEERNATIYAIDSIRYDFPYVRFIANVSKGVYIRKLTEVISDELGVPATTTSLRRLSIGNFKLEDAVTLDELTLENWSSTLRLEPYLTELLPSYLLEEQLEKRFLQGQRIRIDNANEGEYFFYNSMRKLLGSGTIQQSVIHPRVVVQ